MGFSYFVAGDGRTMYPREFLIRFKDLDICKEVPEDLKLHPMLLDTVGGGSMIVSGGYFKSNDRRGGVCITVMWLWFMLGV